MADVFISYAREDLRVAKGVAAALEGAGLSVWWDRRLAGGSEYSREIEKALGESGAIVVLWSKSSVDSSWVRDEAAKGRDAGKLIPATIDSMEPPLGFGQFHTIDLSRQRVGRKRGMNELVAAAKQKIAERGGAGDVPDQPAVAPPTSYRPRLGPAVLIGSVALLAILVATAYLLYGLTSAPQVGEARGGKVVVAGFKPVAADAESRRVAELATGAVERTFATNFIETRTTDAASKAAVADADFTLQGTVDRAKDQVTILASLIEPESGRTLWSTEVSRPADESRELTEELAIFLADVIRCSTYTKRRMPKYDSAEVYSRIFRSCEAERSGGRQYDQFLAVAQALIEVAPKSAQAWANLANASAFLHYDQPQRAYAAGRKALELDPKNGAVRWAFATVRDPKVTLAQRERMLLEGLRLDPEFLWFRNHLGHLMRQAGRREDALKWYQEFVSNYPLDYQVRAFAAYLLAQTGDMRRAREEFERIAEVRPWNRIAPLYAIRAEIFLGDPEKARRWMDVITVSDEDRRCLEMTVAALQSNRTPGIEEIEQKCLGGFLHPAQVLARFGHEEAVIALLAEQEPEGLGTTGPAYVHEPMFAAVRANPRFIPLLVRWGIPQYWLETDNWPDFCSEDDLPYDCREAAKAAVASVVG